MKDYLENNFYKAFGILEGVKNLMIHLHPGTTAQYICNSDALARKAVDNLHLQPSRIKRFWSKIRRLFK